MNNKYGESKYQPKIYILCLASYEQKLFHGEYADATDENQINETIKRVIATSPASEPQDYIVYRYHDFGYLDFFGKRPPISKVVEIAKFIVNHGETGITLMHSYIELLLWAQADESVGNLSDVDVDIDVNDIMEAIDNWCIDQHFKQDLIRCLSILSPYI